MNTKILAILSLLILSTPSIAFWYEEVDCSTNPVFAENSCWGTDQCFLWWEKLQGDNLWLLTDLWKNVTDVSKIVYKDEQVDPEMINLNTDKVNWTKVPNSEDFWEYTDDFNALYSSEKSWYVLESWKSVNWIQSSLSHAFKLEKNLVPAWSNIWMLIYFITVHNILESWDISLDSNEHKECVLFTSWESAEEEIVPEEPKKLPETWPAQFILLLVLAMFLSLWVVKFRTKS